MDEYPDRMADKFAELNAEVAAKLSLKEALDEMVACGELSFDPHTGEYTRLFGDDED